LGGERLYAVVRWVILVVLVDFAVMISQVSLWPLSLDSDPLTLLLAGYAIFCLLTTGVLFIPPLRGLLHIGYAVDILVITLAAFLSGDSSAIFFPLYLLPLLGVAMRYGALTGLLFGFFSALCYLGAAFGEGSLFAQGFDTLVVRDYLSFGLQALVLISAPWIVSNLAAYWSQTNRKRVELAEEQVVQAHQETQIIRDQVQSLFAVAASLTTTMRGEHVLDVLFRESKKLVPYTAGMALLPKERDNRNQLIVATGDGLSLVDPGLTVEVQKGSAVATGLYPPATPQFLTDISQEEDLQNLTTFRSCRAACIVSMLAGVHVHGLLVFAREDTTAFTQDEVNILNALAQYATVAFVNRELEEDVKQDRVNLAKAEENARHWLAREIHDGLAQKLAAIVMNTEFIKRMIEHDSDAAKKELDKLGEIFKRANYDVRTLLGELKPTTLETKGLAAALREYVERLQVQREHIEFVVEAKGVAGMTLSQEAQSTLFNIVQESLNNAMKYAEPQHIWLKLLREGYRLTITIQDDGKGFDVEESKARARARGSYGLSNLNDRAKLIGGTTEIHSTPGEGTTIRVFVPLEV
jgi:signal transduction histidine kinase